MQCFKTITCEGISILSAPAHKQLHVKKLTSGTIVNKKRLPTPTHTKISFWYYHCVMNQASLFSSYMKSINSPMSIVREETGKFSYGFPTFATYLKIQQPDESSVYYEISDEFDFIQLYRICWDNHELCHFLNEYEKYISSLSHEELCELLEEGDQPAVSN